MKHLSIWRQEFIDAFKEQPLKFSMVSSLLVAALITQPDVLSQFTVSSIIFIPMYLTIKLINNFNNK